MPHPAIQYGVDLPAGLPLIGLVKLSTIDAAIVVTYFALLLCVGIFMKRRAGKDLESYFTGGRTMPWWLLGMSGSSTYFDITGTMWMVSVFYLLGMKGMWVHWFWAFPFAGFLMAYKGKWAYRSGVLTGMEWVVFRYGEERAGQAARLTAVTFNLLVIVFYLGYAGTGVGKFLEEFLPYDKEYIIPLLFGFTGLYVVLGGFFSVVYSDFLQTVLLSLAAIYISVIAFLQIDPVAFQESVGGDWLSLAPVWQLENPPDAYQDLFGLLVGLWVIKGVIGMISASGGSNDFQRFRAARTEADASKIGFTWGAVISLRWGLVISFTAFGLSMLGEAGGVVDSESVLPMVLNRVLPIGIKGLVVAGLLAAFMSTFDSSLNVAASFIANDLVKPHWKNPGSRGLVFVSYASTIVLVLLGILISLQTESIDAIWSPINFALASTLIAPNLLAAYWWRISGWSVCASAACTLPVAFYVKLYTDMTALQYFPILFSVSLGATLAAVFLFPSTPMDALKRFYVKVRPFGVWGTVRKELAQEGKPANRPERDRYDIPVAFLGTSFFVCLYITIMDVVLHNWGRAGTLAAVLGLTSVALYFLWWRRLPDGDLQG